MKMQGFTLVGIMVVALIIGLLAVITIPGFLTFRMTSGKHAHSARLGADQAAEEQDGEPMPLRILTYNIRNGRGLDAPLAMNTERIARVITAQKPDVVALQELDRQTQRSGGRDVLQELADATGMVGTYGQAIAYQGGAYGVGILSRKPPLNVYQRRLDCASEPRTLLVCEFDAFVLFCTHLPLVETSRVAAVEMINKELSAFKKTVFLAGDFNARPDSAAIRALETVWRRISPLEPTYPANQPRITIDYLFVAKDAQVETIESCVVDEPAASDHRPVFAWLRVGG